MYLYNNLPKALKALALLISRISVHYQHIQGPGGKDLIGRMDEIYIRRIENRLRKLSELGATDFSKSYDLKQKTICTCRDFAVMLCSMLRHVGIPARVRYGFAQYLDRDPNFFFDHIIVEYWDEIHKEWLLSERYLTSEVKDRFNIDFDTYNVPRDKFITASSAWITCRAGSASEHSFGTGYARRRSGLWYLRNKIIQDLASLNKVEMQPSDLWGYMINVKPVNTVSESELILMDKIADDMLNPDENLEQLQHLYRSDDALCVQNSVCPARINGNQVLEPV